MNVQNKSDSLLSSGDIDFDHMRVVELRKRLKDLNLPYNGSKADLVERLTDYWLKSSEISPELQETSIIPAWLRGAEEAYKDLQSTEEAYKDLHSAEEAYKDPLDENFSIDDLLASPAKEKPKSTAPESIVPNSAIPLKKRVLAQSANDEAPKIEVRKQKIVLKRNNVPTPKITPMIKKVTIVNPSKTVLEKQTASSNEAALMKPVSSVNVSNSVEKPLTTGKDGTNRVVLLSAKNLSQNERLSLRSEKFSSVSKEGALKGGKATFSPVVVDTNTTASRITFPSVSNLEILRKRAERFGQNVSGLSKQLDDQQRVLKRKSKFGAISVGKNGIDSMNEQEKKKKRAERFGL